MNAHFGRALVSLLLVLLTVAPASAMIKTDAITTRTLAADSVTSAKIVAGTIVASDIASATITANEIAASSITADRLSVSTLSAISADLGTITAGNISAVTISGSTLTAGGGDVVIDADGITIAGGTADPNKIKWTTGAAIYTTGAGAFFIDSNGGLTLNADADGSAAQIFMTSNNVTLGDSDDLIQAIGANVRLNGFTGATRVVCTDSAGNLVQGASNTAC